LFGPSLVLNAPLSDRAATAALTRDGLLDRFPDEVVAALRPRREPRGDHCRADFTDSVDQPHQL